MTETHVGQADIVRNLERIPGTVLLLRCGMSGQYSNESLIVAGTFHLRLKMRRWLSTGLPSRAMAFEPGLPASLQDLLELSPCALDLTTLAWHLL